MDYHLISMVELISYNMEQFVFSTMNTSMFILFIFRFFISLRSFFFDLFRWRYSVIYDILGSLDVDKQKYKSEHGLI